MSHNRREAGFTPEIEITKGDIELAKQRDRWGCAIVRAIQRQYPDATRVRVDTQAVAFTIGERRYVAPTPDEAITKIIKPLDEGKRVRPTTIKLTDVESMPKQHADPERIREGRHYSRTHEDNRTETERNCNRRTNRLGEDAA